MYCLDRDFFYMQVSCPLCYPAKRGIQVRNTLLYDLLYTYWLTMIAIYPHAGPVVHGAMDCGQKSFKPVWWCYQLLSWFLAIGHLPRVSRQSRRSLMVRMIMKWSRGLCTDLLAFALELKKTSAMRPYDEGAVRPVIALNGVLCLQMRSVAR